MPIRDRDRDYSYLATIPYPIPIPNYGSTQLQLQDHFEYRNPPLVTLLTPPVTPPRPPRVPPPRRGVLCAVGEGARGSRTNEVSVVLWWVERSVSMFALGRGWVEGGGEGRHEGYFAGVLVVAPVVGVIGVVVAWCC